MERLNPVAGINRDQQAEEHTGPARKQENAPQTRDVDIDTLFPEPEIRQLLDDIAGDLEEVDRFVIKIRSELDAERRLRRSNASRRDGTRAE